MSGGITHRLAVISPALCLHSHARLPLRANICGFPFFHSLRPRGGSAPVALERWTSEAGSREAGRASPLLRMTVCVDGAELAAVQRRARARRRHVVVARGGGGGEAGEHAEHAEEEVVDGDEDEDDDDESDDDDDDDEDEWDWSGELSLEADEVGRRQRVCLQSEGGRLRLLACELSADGGGVLHATLFDEPQPPLVLHNRTQHTLFLCHACAPPLGDAPLPAPSHEVLKLGPGRTGRFFMGGGAPKAAAADGTPTSKPSTAPSENVLLLGLQRDMVAGYNPAMGAVPGGAALRLAPPRVLSLRLLPPRDLPPRDRDRTPDCTRDRTSAGASQPLDLEIAISLHGPTCTLHLLPAATAAFARPAQAAAAPRALPSELSAACSIGRLSLCLWAERGQAAANAAVALLEANAAGAAAAPTHDGTAALHGGGAPARRLKGGPLLHLTSEGLECALRRSVQPAALPERLRLRLPRAPATSTSTSVQCTLRTVQLDSWGGGAAAAPRVVLCAEGVPQRGRPQRGGSAAAAAAAPRRAVARVSLIASRHGAAPAHLQLAEVRLLPLALALDDLLVARVSALLEASAICARSTHAALRPTDDGAPYAAATNGPRSSAGAATPSPSPSPLGLIPPRAARAPPLPLLYVEQLSVSEVSVALSAITLTSP